MDWCSDLSRRIAHTGTRGREEALPRSRRGSPSLKIQKGFPHSLGAGKTSCLKTSMKGWRGRAFTLRSCTSTPSLLPLISVLSSSSLNIWSHSGGMSSWTPLRKAEQAGAMTLLRR